MWTYDDSLTWSMWISFFYRASTTHPFGKVFLGEKYGDYRSVFLWKSRFGTQKSRFGTQNSRFGRLGDFHGVNFPGCTWVVCEGSCAVAPAFNLYQEVGTWLETEQRRNNRVVLFNYTLELFITFQIIITPLVSQYAIVLGHPKTSLLYRELEFNSTLLKHLTKW